MAIFKHSVVMNRPVGKAFEFMNNMEKEILEGDGWFISIRKMDEIGQISIERLMGFNNPIDSSEELS
jgi:hypothetical protein